MKSGRNESPGSKTGLGRLSKPGKSSKGRVRVPLSPDHVVITGDGIAAEARIKPASKGSFKKDWTKRTSIVQVRQLQDPLASSDMSKLNTPLVAGVPVIGLSVPLQKRCEALNERAKVAMRRAQQGKDDASSTLINQARVAMLDAKTDQEFKNTKVVLESVIKNASVAARDRAHVQKQVDATLTRTAAFSGSHARELVKPLHEKLVQASKSGDIGAIMKAIADAEASMAKLNQDPRVMDRARRWAAQNLKRVDNELSIREHPRTPDEAVGPQELVAMQATSKVLSRYLSDLEKGIYTPQPDLNAIRENAIEKYNERVFAKPTGKVEEFTSPAREAVEHSLGKHGTLKPFTQNQERVLAKRAKAAIDRAYRSGQSELARQIEHAYSDWVETAIRSTDMEKRAITTGALQDFINVAKHIKGSSKPIPGLHDTKKSIEHALKQGGTNRTTVKNLTPKRAEDFLHRGKEILDKTDRANETSDFFSEGLEKRGITPGSRIGGILKGRLDAIAEHSFLTLKIDKLDGLIGDVKSMKGDNVINVQNELQEMQNKIISQRKKLGESENFKQAKRLLTDIEKNADVGGITGNRKYWSNDLILKATMGDEAFDKFSRDRDDLVKRWDALDKKAIDVEHLITSGEDGKTGVKIPSDEYENVYKKLGDLHSMRNEFKVKMQGALQEGDEVAAKGAVDGFEKAIEPKLLYKESYIAGKMAGKAKDLLVAIKKSKKNKPSPAIGADGGINTIS